MEPWKPLSVNAVRHQPPSHFPCGNGACSRTDGLEIVMRNGFHGFRSGENDRSHAVASGDIFGAAFREKRFQFADMVGELNGIEIIGVFQDDQFDAIGLRNSRPHLRKREFGHDDHRVDFELRSILKKGAARVASGGDDDCPFFAFGNSRENGSGFQFFEGAGRHAAFAFRPIAVEGEIEVFQTKPVAKRIALEDNGFRGAGERSANR